MTIQCTKRYAVFPKPASSSISRGKLLSSFACIYPKLTASGYAWPVFKMRIRDIKPAGFGQRVRGTATVLEYGFRLRIGYRITDAETGEVSPGSPLVLFEKLGVAR